jgi:hypothetical protein
MFLRALDHNTGSALAILDHVVDFLDHGDIVLAVLADVMETNVAVDGNNFARCQRVMTLLNHFR